MLDATDSTPPLAPTAGPPVSVEFGGKVFLLGRPTQAAKDRFCEAVVDAEQAALQALRTRRLVTDDEYFARLERLGGRIDRGEHKPGRALWAEYAVGGKAAAGMELYVWSLFAERHPDMPLTTVREMMAGNSPALMLALRRVVPDFFGWVGEVAKLPPEKVAAVVEQGLAALASVPGPSGDTTP